MPLFLGVSGNVCLRSGKFTQSERKGRHFGKILENQTLSRKEGDDPGVEMIRAQNDKNGERIAYSFWWNVNLSLCRNKVPSCAVASSSCAGISRVLVEVRPEGRKVSTAKARESKVCTCPKARTKRGNGQWKVKSAIQPLIASLKGSTSPRRQFPY